MTKETTPTEVLKNALVWFKKEQSIVWDTENEDDDLSKEYYKIIDKCQSLDDDNGLDEDFDLDDIISERLMYVIEDGDDMQDFIITEIGNIERDPGNDTSPFITLLAWLRAGAKAQYEDVLYGVDTDNPNDIEEVDPDDLADVMNDIINEIKNAIKKGNRHD